MRKGILVAGNWIIDQVKMIDVFPEEEQLVNISAQCSSNGGSAYNITNALSRLGVDFPLSALGLVGNDTAGADILKHCHQMGINTDQLRVTNDAHTSYTDVMTVMGTGRRTFFHQRGANALLNINHFDFSSANEKIFHLGYLLLLDKLDEVDKEGNTGASLVFQSAKAQGFLTSADIVSERSDRFNIVIPPALPFIDYLFVNEFEAGMLTGLKTVSQGKTSFDHCMEAARKILAMGVNRWVFLHFPDGVIAKSRDGTTIFQPSIELPPDRVAGAVGAGDAFAAGVLLGLHNDYQMERCLTLGVCAAASSLFKTTSSEGILSEKECMDLTRSYGFRGAK